MSVVAVVLLMQLVSVAPHIDELSHPDQLEWTTVSGGHTDRQRDQHLDPIEGTHEHHCLGCALSSQRHLRPGQSAVQPQRTALGLAVPMGPATAARGADRPGAPRAPPRS